ncbi:FtsX-like permease family protein [bacterium]|nr:FtsX-like permease family protein [bacterium]
MSDLRFALRQLLKNPGFTAVAVLTLALGIGANTAIFGALYQVVLKPLPFPDSDQLVQISGQSQNAEHTTRDLSVNDFRLLEESIRPYLAIAGEVNEIRNLSGAGIPLRAWGARVSPRFFDVLGVSPIIGRTFATNEFIAGANQVVILTHALWQERFGGRKDIIGEHVILDGRSMTVCGVMPPSFQFPHKLTTYWTPLVLTADEIAESDSPLLSVVGRMANGVSGPELLARLQSLSQSLPENKGAKRSEFVALTGTQLLTERLGDSRRVLWILFAAVTCATLIGAANLINLFLTRVSARQKEFAVRIALGARRRRIVRQWLSESLLLSLTAGALGLVLATWSIKLLRTYAPYGLPRADEIALDPTIIAFAFVLALLLGMGASLFPLVHFLLRNREGNTLLRNRDGVSPAGRGRRSWLVLTQSAVATVLLIGAGLLWTSFQRVIAVDPGFTGEHLLTARVVLSEGKYDDDAHRRNFYRQLTERASALPEVSAAGLVNSLPLSEINFRRPITIENYEPSGGTVNGESVRGNYVSVSENYFSLMGIPMLAGRSFEPADETGAPVVVISETLAHRYFPNSDAIGRRIKIGPGKWRPWMTVVGVVADVKSIGRDTPAEPTFYVPCLQPELPTYTMQGMFLVVKTRVAPDAIVNRLRGELYDIDPDLALANIETMDERLQDSVADRQFQSTLMALFAALAVVLAMTGVFGVLSCVVADRQRELGVRMALGSSRSGLFRLVLQQGLKPVFAGIALGWVLAFLFRGALAGLLFGISSNDPRTFLLVGMAFTTVATLACLIPARRAASIDPMEALRTE